jgi:creatinine amidohydrolase/Fe(II)-dependent formamide hydrolase-like protein
MPQRKTGENSAVLKSDALAVLGVIDRLEVGPVDVERNRLRVPYRVTKKVKTDEILLAYRFEEDVFAPYEAESINLAAMIGVQVALNYGLFCHEIVLRGQFHKEDQEFIKEMASNTAREIYVKKFLEPNPFLFGPAAELPAVRQPDYLRADILFPDQGAQTGQKTREKTLPWEGDTLRHAILSSGGKDSLLSFGLLREMNREVHPVFINESGRHWFTALNAYRHFADSVSRTARVWTNSDRVFTWMLRHLPFVLRDFEKIRSDEYPIRLWTVAVFVFGALPLLRKRGISRLVIGDEFDTTRKRSFRGITHYDGLYDQSRYFDDALTRYFGRKGWSVSQFSVLRPLSELMVQKILVERYPELQCHQVSCHAAHEEKNRIRPCGRCEKCRRIVATLLALGAEPGHCGYTSQQIDRCLAALMTKEIHSEIPVAEHVAFLLKEKGLISGPHIRSARARPREETMRLRFHDEQSPVNGIPGDLRESLFRICLEHADGVVKRNGKAWQEFDLFNDPTFKRPSPFEPTKDVSSVDHHDRNENEGVARGPLLAQMTWPEASKRFKSVDVALLPVGAIEQHGPHLPLDADAFDAEYLAREVAKACSEPTPIVLPLIPYGVSYHHEDFSGTISVNPETLSRLVYDIGMSVARHGARKLVIINGHGGNSPALHFAAQMINRDAHIFTCVDTGETSDPDIYAMAETPNDVHAGEIETSTTLAVRPEVVRLKVAKKFVPRFSSTYLNFTSKRSVTWYTHTAKISPSGVLGDPTKATAEKGRRMWEKMITNLVEFVEHLKNMTLKELYQKRY